MFEEIEDYLLSFHKTDLLEILENADTSQHFPLNIDFIQLYEHKPNSVVELLNAPEKCLGQWDKAALRAQMALLKDADERCQLKNNIHCRIFHLPLWPAVRRSTFPGNRDVGKFFQLSGTVMRVTTPKLLEFQRSYICVTCKMPMEVKAEYDRNHMIKQPKKCDNSDCNGSNFVSFGGLESGNCKDYQEVKIQEQVKQLGMGSMPDVLCVTLEDDLVDSCKPGDNVTVCGVLKRRWGEFVKGKTIDIQLALKANYVQVDNSSASMTVSTPETRQMFNDFWEKYRGNPLEGRDVMLKSFCKQIYGLYLVKLAIAVVLAGGGPTAAASAAFRPRSESHLLLVGDPGTGKSQLLRFATKVVPRSVLTTGVGSTAAGLTVTATMDQGEWHLEGGALVMADGGICCIDEFNSMKEHDRTTIHEAMEQQTISVAKAGIVTKLNTRCSILAACNPKGNIDPTQSLAMNIALPSPLLSRFDLILMLRDVVDHDWDEQVADYILNGGHEFSKLTDSGLWTIEVLQSYFVTIKKLQPKLTEDAETILDAYYQMHRGINGRNKARTTVRLLESLVRLSRGHARLMFHDEIQVVDSIFAIILADISMDRDCALLNLNVTLNSVFPERPAFEYRAMLETILSKLHLTEILDRELESIPKINYGTVQSRFFHGKPQVVNEEPERNRRVEPHRFADLSINESELGVTDEGYDTFDSNLSKAGTSGLNQKSDGRSHRIDNGGLGKNNAEASKTLEIAPTSEPTVEEMEIERLARHTKTSGTYSKLDSDFIQIHNRKSAGAGQNEMKESNILEQAVEKSDNEGAARTVSTNEENQVSDHSNKANKSNTLAIPSSSEHRSEELENEGPVKVTKPSESIKRKMFVTNGDHSKAELKSSAHINKTNYFDRDAINGSELDVLFNLDNLFGSNSKSNCPDQSSRSKKPKMIYKYDNTMNSSGSSTWVPNVEQVDSGNKQVNEVAASKSNSLVKEKLKKFEFVRRHKSEDPPKKEAASKDTFSSAQSNENENDGEGHTADTLENDLELLKYMPGVKDDFGVDLDFDWDNYSS